MSDFGESVLRETVQQWMPGAEVEKIVPLTPDASLRRYFRLFLRGGVRPATVVASIFDSVACPEAAGACPVNSFDACVLLTERLEAAGVSVPQIHFTRREPYVLLSEDLGDTALSDLVLRRKPLSRGASLEGLYRKAIEEIYRFQGVPHDGSFFAFQRIFSGEVYRKEMGEFEEFVLTPRGVESAVMSAVSAACDLLGARLEARPRVLVHRDFHSWNLMVDEAGRVRVIDFQDALMAPQVYDFIGLLNDRDTDAALGVDLYKRLVRYCFELSGRSAAEFFGEYDEALLQRDLKVAGRFAKLVAVRGLESYRGWIAGTVQRIGRTLQRMELRRDCPAEFRELCRVLRGVLPEVLEGWNTPVSFEA